MAHASALLGIATALAIPIASAPAPPTSDALPTARVHRLPRSDRSALLEAALPRTGPYARGIAADADLDFQTSERAYEEAAGELLARGRERLAEKAARQRTLSQTILRSLSPSPTRPGIHVPSYLRYPIALAYHEKYLATRAFLGSDVPSLLARAESAYREVLDLEPGNVAARLGFAALIAEAGDRDRAEEELARVPEPTRREEAHASSIARYHAACGRIDEAIAALSRVRHRSMNDQQDLMLGNAFDLLRDDPRFDTLLKGTPPPPPFRRRMPRPTLSPLHLP